MVRFIKYKHFQTHQSHRQGRLVLNMIQQSPRCCNNYLRKVLTRIIGKGLSSNIRMQKILETFTMLKELPSLKHRLTWHGSDSRRFWSTLKRVPPTRVWTPMPLWYFNRAFASAASWLASSLVGQRMRTKTGGTRWTVLVLAAFKTVSIAGSCLSLTEEFEGATIIYKITNYN